MLDGLVETAAQAVMPYDRRIYGVVVAQVVDNVDLRAEGRVKIRLTCLPEIEPWARVATLMAGMSTVGTGYGAYFIPQTGDEVLVAFNGGDVNEPYIIGCLWNPIRRPPTLVPTDAVSKRIIRTPIGHEVEFDDAKQSITITSSTKQKITLDPTKVEMTTAEGGATVTLDTKGSASIQSTHSITLNAPKIALVENATHPVVFGEQLLQYLNQLVALYQVHTHVVPPPVGPVVITAPPVPPLLPAPPTLISTRVITG